MLTNVEKIMLYGCLALLAALVLFIAAALVVRAISLSRKKEICVQATISDMTVTDMSVMKAVSLNADRNSNVIEFDTGKEKIKLQVSRWIYGTLEPGMSGTLTYKDNVFINFAPDAPVETADGAKEQ